MSCLYNITVMPLDKHGVVSLKSNCLHKAIKIVQKEYPNIALKMYKNSLENEYTFNHGMYLIGIIAKI